MSLRSLLRFGKQPAAQTTEITSESAGQSTTYTGKFTRAMPVTEAERLKIFDGLRVAASAYKGDRPGFDALEKRTEGRERVTVGCRVTTLDENLSFRVLPAERNEGNLTAVVRTTDKGTYEKLVGAVKEYGFTEVAQPN